MNDFETNNILVKGIERYAHGVTDWRFFGWPNVGPQESAASRALRGAIYGANDSRNGWEGPSDPIP